MVQRWHQLVLIFFTLGASWLGMQVVHETGHVLGAWLTGGTISLVVLHPLTISRTDLSVNPQPMLVAWAGPVVGVLLPLALWGTAVACRMPGTFLVRFFAGFCLVANGAYLGVGSLAGIGDAEDLLRNSSPIVSLWAFGSFAVPLGFLLWHRQGRNFGLGSARGKVHVVAAYIALAAFLGLIVLGMVVGGNGPP